MAANFTATPTSGSADLTVSFTDTSIGAPTSWDWDFGDGSAHSIVQNPSHLYTIVGIYSVTLIATNALGSNTLIRSNYITVNMLANFTATPTTVCVNQAVYFTDTSIGAPTGWLWNFGDNTSSTIENPEHTYVLPGAYTVTLTSNHGSSSDTVVKYYYIVVTRVISTIDIAPPPDRRDLQTMSSKGGNTYLFVRKGIKAFITNADGINPGSGFTRPDGPSIIFD